MRRILKVAQREYAETVRTKTFILSMLMTPVFVGLIIFLGGRITGDRSGPRPDRHIALSDLSGELSDEIKAAFDRHNASSPGRKLLLQQLPISGEDTDAFIERQKSSVRDGGRHAYVVLDKDIIEGAGKITVYSRSAKISDFDLLSTIRNLINNVVVNRRCELQDVSPELLSELRRRVRAELVDVGSASREQRVGRDAMFTRMMVPFAFMFFMFMGIFGMGQHMLSSIIEEKSSRVIEVLLSAISPFQLMAGKILGLAGIGLTVIGIWAVAAYTAARWQGIDVPVTGEILVYFAVYYTFGFLLFSAFLAGIGSICNTIKEAQSLMMPVSLLFVVPMIAWVRLIQEPEGTLTRVLSFVPPLTPMVMILRISAGGVSGFEIFASLVVLAVSVPVVVWMAAKVFRTGILMYGKRPRLGEVLRWLGQG